MASHTLPDFNTQGGTAYKTNIDASIAANDFATSTITSGSVAATTDAVMTWTHGLGSDDLDYGFKVLGNHGTYAFAAAVSCHAIDPAGNINEEAPNGNAIPVTAVAQASAGQIRLVVRNNGGATQTITVKIWARVR